MEHITEPACRHCGEAMDTNGDSRLEYLRQADALGMESLTENQQLLVDSLVCEECYDALESENSPCQICSD